MRTRFSRTLALTAALAIGTVGLGASPASAADGGTIYTISNDASSNELHTFTRSTDGTLTPSGAFATGGVGSGGGLGSQGAVTLSDDGDTVLVVNAGSDDISVFDVSTGTPTLTDVEPSLGADPISVDIDGDRVAVVNAGSADVATFHLADGDLTPVSGTTEPLSSPEAGPAQVAFTPDGRTLVVTEKATNSITTYEVATDGSLGSAIVTDSSGATPFGFTFDPRGHLIVTEAFGGAADASTVSSYSLGRTRAPAVLDAQVPTTETAACWAVATDDGRYVYTTNTGSDSVTGYRLHANGGLDPLDDDGVTATTGDMPIDATIAGGYLYTVDAGDDQISVFRIGHDGSLTHVQTVPGLASTGVGIAGS